MKTILVDAADTFTIEIDGQYVIFDELYKLVETYPNRKIIVTNANEEQVKQYGLVDLPYELFSLKHNPNKPDSDYFNKLLSFYNLKADDVVYFEHDATAVDSAKSVGIVSYFYDASKKDINALRAFLDKNL